MHLWHVGPPAKGEGVLKSVIYVTSESIKKWGR